MSTTTFTPPVAAPAAAPVATAPATIDTKPPAIRSQGGYFDEIFGGNQDAFDRDDLAHFRLENGIDYNASNKGGFGKFLGTVGKAITGFTTGLGTYGLFGLAMGCLAVVVAVIAAPLIPVLAPAIAAAAVTAKVGVAAYVATTVGAFVVPTASACALIGSSKNAIKAVHASGADSRADRQMDNVLKEAARIGASDRSPDDKQKALARLTMQNRGLMDSNLAGAGGLAGAAMGAFGAHKAGGGLFSKLAGGIGGAILGNKAGDRFSANDKKLYALLNKAAEAGCKKSHDGLSIEEYADHLAEVKSRRAVPAVAATVPVVAATVPAVVAAVATPAVATQLPAPAVQEVVDQTATQQAAATLQQSGVTAPASVQPKPALVTGVSNTASVANQADFKLVSKDPAVEAAIKDLMGSAAAVPLGTASSINVPYASPPNAARNVTEPKGKSV